MHYNFYVPCRAMMGEKLFVLKFGCQMLCYRVKTPENASEPVYGPNYGFEMSVNLIKLKFIL